MLKINWENRFDALEPAALVAVGGAAIRLARKLLSFDDAKLNVLQGVCADDLLFVAGKSDDLPWVENAIYFGKDKLAPRVFLPTTRRPNVPIDLFERALAHRFGEKLPCAAFDDKIVLIGAMRLVARAVLENWLREKL